MRLSFPSAWLDVPAIFLVGIAPADGQNVVPSQFIAKMYTEALGRAPDQAGWSRDVQYFTSAGCGSKQLSTVGIAVYTSQEFAPDNFDPEARVLALYRGALNRDPDPGGLANYVGLLKSGARWESVVNDIFTSQEFNSGVAAVCSSSAPNYHFSGQVPPTLTAGSHGFTGTQAALNRC